MDNVVWLDHYARAPSQGTGRGTSSGQSPSGQFSENQRSARSKRPTVKSDPVSSAPSFLPSLKARELTVDKGMRSISAYRRATVSSCSIPDITDISVNVPVLSTAILPDAQNSRSGQSTGMDLAVVLQNIERLLELKQRSADAVSRAAGVPDAIRNLKRTVRGKIKAAPTMRTIAALADELKVSVDDLIRPRERIEIQPVPGMRETILKKIEWLDREKQQALDELEALEHAEMNLRKVLRKKIR